MKMTQEEISRASDGQNWYNLNEKMVMLDHNPKYKANIYIYFNIRNY